MIKLKDSFKSPPDGHRYAEEGFACVGETFDAVARKLAIYREHNAWPIGNPEQDVLNYYAKHWPSLVEQDEALANPFDVLAVIQGEIDIAYRNRDTIDVSSPEWVRRKHLCESCEHSTSDDTLSQDHKARIYKLAVARFYVPRMCNHHLTHCTLACIGSLNCKKHTK
jgi:hypothetical protein